MHRLLERHTGLPASVRTAATCPPPWWPGSRGPGPASSTTPSPSTRRSRRSGPASADERNTASVITSRSASASTRRDACDSSPTRARRLRTMRPNVTSEWPSCARKSPVASAPRGVPTTSPECDAVIATARKQGWNVLQTLGSRSDATNPPTAPLRTPAPLPARTPTIPHIQTLGPIRPGVTIDDLRRRPAPA